MDYIRLLLCVVVLTTNCVKGNIQDFAEWQTKIENKISSLENENRELKHRVDGLEGLLKESETEKIRIGNILRSQQENTRGFDTLHQAQEYPKNQTILHGDKEMSSTTN
jgi:hypothetical protein